MAVLQIIINNARGLRYGTHTISGNLTGFYTPQFEGVVETGVEVFADF